MNDFYTNMTHRTAMVLGDHVLEKLGAVRVIIFGVGGVGSWCAEALVRTGLVNLTIVDSDIVCPTNINRQVQAVSGNVGKSKVDELRKRLLDINPSASITSLHAAYDETSKENFGLGSYDYVIDAIDSLQNKILLIEECSAAGVKLFSSMGAAAKTDPSKIRTGPLSETKNCPLARLVRRHLRKKNIPLEFTCVYSEEIPVDPATETVCGTGDCPCTYDRERFCAENPGITVDWCDKKKRINGALAHITGIFGFMLASLVINDIAAQQASNID